MKFETRIKIKMKLKLQLVRKKIMDNLLEVYKIIDYLISNKIV